MIVRYKSSQISLAISLVKHFFRVNKITSGLNSSGGPSFVHAIFCPYFLDHSLFYSDCVNTNRVSIENLLEKLTRLHRPSPSSSHCVRNAKTMEHERSHRWQHFMLPRRLFITKKILSTKKISSNFSHNQEDRGRGKKIKPEYIWLHNNIDKLSLFLIKVLKMNPWQKTFAHTLFLFY